MIGTTPDCPASVQLLADHLDASLAAGEDLLALVLPPRADLDETDPENAPEALDLFTRRLMQLELALLMRVLQARRRAGELGRADGMLKAAANLFRTQTNSLLDVIERLDRTRARPLGGSGDSHAYLRSRGMLAAEAAAPSPYECLAASETFRIGGVLEIGLLLDMASSLLDLLDARFGLYKPSPDDVIDIGGCVAGEASETGDALPATAVAEPMPPPELASAEASEAVVVAHGQSADAARAQATDVAPDSAIEVVEPSAVEVAFATEPAEPAEYRSLRAAIAEIELPA